MIRNIIFDIGNVLTDFRWQDFIKDRGYAPEIGKRIGKATVEDEDWHEFDRGVWSFEELMDHFVENDPGIEKEIRETFADVTDLVVKREYAIPWIRSLKKRGYKVFVLSNFSEKAYYECADALSFLKETDGGILSFRDKVIKPYPEIYKLLLDRYDLVADECVFIDDTPRNLPAAENMGIHTIPFMTKEQVDRDLERMLSGSGRA
ncbi:MAG: HAD family phosphatase [Lachnospiraceae bacterium]|nr:HAD family phosphatase [Lachnospiraceae bacterium]